MPLIVYSSPFVPPEWIAAHGWTPRRLLPRGTGGDAMRTGICPHVLAFRDAVREARAGAVVICGACDQMRRLPDLRAGNEAPPAFLLHLPRTRSPAARALYGDELDRLGRFLQRGGGHAPAPGGLAAAMTAYDRRRARLRAACEARGGRAAAEALARFGHAGRARAPAAPPSGDAPIPVALIGGPVSAAEFDLYDEIERHGGRVMFDGAETGLRGWPPPFDLRRVAADPREALIDAYFDGIPDVAHRPNTRLFEWLRAGAERASVRGVVLVRAVWCDLWHAEAPRIRELLGLPFADLVLDGGPLPAHARVRIQALMEALAS